MFEDLPVNRYEKVLAQELPRSRGSVLAGISRALRLSRGDRCHEEAVAVATAADVVGPLTFFFAWWVLDNARRRGITRLYFMARDGEILYKVARVLVEQWELPVEVRYLHCSREALLLPSFQSAGDFEMNWITWGYAGSITWLEILRRLDLEGHDLSPLLERHGLTSVLTSPATPLAGELFQRLHLLLKDEELAALVRERVRPRYETTLAYLRQEGLTDGTPFALVDTGWRGSSQYALSSLLQKAAEREGGVTGFYLGLNCDAYCYPGDDMASFLFDWRTGRRDYLLYNFICIEMLCGAGHGRTLGYRRKEGRFEPVLGPEVPEHLRQVAGHHHRLAEEYARLAARQLQFSSPSADFSSDLVRRLLRIFICAPDPRQAEMYGNVPMASEIREGDCQVLAPAMTFGGFLRCALGKEKVTGFWPQGSLLRGKQRGLVAAYNLFLRSGLLDWYRRTLLKY